LSGRAEELCSFLRAKVTGAPHGDKTALFALRNDATTIYWCLLTMSPSGPDDGLAHAARCGAERVCCVPQSDENVG
jgi:hypothetical protein